MNMDVDGELEAQLLRQFSSMGTTDKEVLIAEFQKLLGHQLNESGCAFFLDMNDWNLQAAIGAYYDYEQPNLKLPGCGLVGDVTIGEGESVPPNTEFVKTWRIRNSGDEKWPPGCSLKYVTGDQFSHRDRVMVHALEPGEERDVSVDMRSPISTGIFQGQWRMSTATGLYFGDIIWVIVQVEESGLLGVTQQLSQFGSDFTHHQPPVNVQQQNPFASPSKTGGGFGCEAPFSSPTPSMVACQGSLPPSPSMHNSDSSFSPSSLQARAALFQECQASPSRSAFCIQEEESCQRQQEMDDMS